MADDGAVLFERCEGLGLEPTWPAVFKVGRFGSTVATLASWLVKNTDAPQRLVIRRVPPLALFLVAYSRGSTGAGESRADRARDRHLNCEGQLCGEPPAVIRLCEGQSGTFSGRL